MFSQNSVWIGLVNAYNAFVFRLENGNRIKYGEMPAFEATHEDYLMKGKGVLLQILVTYETTE